MKQIAPSLLSADFSIAGKQLDEIKKENIKYLHIDVMDGMFVPSLSFGFPVIKTLRKAFDFIFDVHLMIEEPSRYIEEFARAGSDIITVHYEACSDTEAVLKRIHELGCRTGLAVRPGTPFSEITRYLKDVDMILIMTVEPGFGGQKYIDAMTDKIKECRKYLSENGYDILIETDGGINKATIQTVAEAGADILVSGSAVFNGNISQNIEELKACLNRASEVAE